MKVISNNKWQRGNALKENVLFKNKKRKRHIYNLIIFFDLCLYNEIKKLWLSNLNEIAVSK